MAGLFFDQIGDISQRIREIARCQRITRQRTAGHPRSPTARVCTQTPDQVRPAACTLGRAPRGSGAKLPQRVAIENHRHRRCEQLAPACSDPRPSPRQEVGGTLFTCAATRRVRCSPGCSPGWPGQRPCCEHVEGLTHASAWQLRRAGGLAGLLARPARGRVRGWRPSRVVQFD